MQTLNKTDSPATRPAEKKSYLAPHTNIVENEGGYILTAEMPGVSKEELDITVDHGELTIVGHRKTPGDMGTLVMRESRDADYRRIFELDPAIDGAKITAKIENGVLRLVLPKAEAAKPKKIVVS